MIKLKIYMIKFDYIVLYINEVFIINSIHNLFAM